MERLAEYLKTVAPHVQWVAVDKNDDDGVENLRSLDGVLWITPEPGLEGYLFCSDSLPGGARIRKLETSKEPDNQSQLHARIIRKSNVEQRLVYGVVLAPDVVDSQGDTISKEDIEKAAHTFMSDYQNVGLQHGLFINGRARIVESFIAPSDMTMGGELVTEGTWVMVVKVMDDELWGAVKSGDLTGFSIGGAAVREQV
jgi:DNA adenine methylase